jgi:hypothetical protein
MYTAMFYFIHENCVIYCQAGKRPTGQTQNKMVHSHTSRHLNERKELARNGKAEENNHKNILSSMAIENIHTPL